MLGRQQETQGAKKGMDRDRLRDREGTLAGAALTVQALIDGPTTGVPRQSLPYRNMILTPYTIASLPRGAGSGSIKKAVEKAGVTEKWEASGWAKKLAARQSRKVCLVSYRRVSSAEGGVGGRERNKDAEEDVWRRARHPLD